MGEKIEWGPNWEEILGGEFAKRSADVNFRAGAGHVRPVREHLHDVPAARASTARTRCVIVPSLDLQARTTASC